MAKKLKISFFRKKAFEILSFIYSLAKKYRKYTIPSVFFILLSSIADTLEPYAYKKFINVLENSFDEAFALEIFLRALFLVLVFRILGFFFFEIGSLLFVNFNARSIKTLFVKAFSHVESLSYRFHSSHKSGSTFSVIRRGAQAFDRISDSIFFSIIPLIFKIPLFIILVALVQGWIAVLVALLLIAFIVWSIYVNERIQKYQTKINYWEDRSAGVILDSLLNFEAVKAFNQEKNQEKRFQKLENKAQKYRLTGWGIYSWVGITSASILVSGFFLLFVISIFKYIEGSFTLGDIILIGTLVSSITPQLYFFQHSYRNIRRSITEMEELLKLFNEKPTVLDHPFAKNLSSFKRKIQFQNVTFGYQKNQPVLRNITFDVPMGTRVALVGHSGAGKTTLLKLLLRFYDVTQGKILIDEKNISQVTQKSLRDLISTVPQDPIMFHDTIRNNILFGNPKASFQDITEAAKRATAHGFIEKLPKQYDTLVGERGIKLSGGERQRVAIARAILANTPIVILDEATSSLDSASEAQIQKALNELMRGRTTFTIAHRLSTIKSSDMIIIMDESRIVDIGKHEELLKKSPIYEKLWNLQAGGFIKE
jgi:ATP-binding cassette subfamily B protein